MTEQQLPHEGRPSRRLRDEVEDPARRRWVGPAVAVGLAMGAAAIAGLVLNSVQKNGIYSKPVDELLAGKAKFLGRPVRAEGMLFMGRSRRESSPANIASRLPRTALRFRFALPSALCRTHLGTYPDWMSESRSKASCSPTTPSKPRACSRSAQANTTCSSVSSAEKKCRTAPSLRTNSQGSTATPNSRCASCRSAHNGARPCRQLGDYPPPAMSRRAAWRAAHRVEGATSQNR